jgi:exo-beta-1,3-glucanase (GH17 family)
MRIARFMLLILLFAPACGGDAARPEVNGLTAESLWAAYAPTLFNPNNGTFPSDESMREDLKSLYAEGFRGIVTYASDGTLNHIPRLARDLGFKLVYMGIYCPLSPSEVAAALAESTYVDGYVVGNEGLGDNRVYCAYDTTQLQATMEWLRQSSGKPVSTSEQVDDYLQGPWSVWLLDRSDWVFPNVHPYWAGLTNPDSAVAWTIDKYEAVQQRTAKPVTIKETGLPSAGRASCSEQRQSEFYERLSSTSIPFFHFEAFDQPWKVEQPVEAHWGVNDSNRSPKLVVRRK